MKIIRRYLLLSLALLLAGAPPADAQNREQQLKALQKSITELQRWLDDARDQRDKLETELRLTETEIGKVTGQIKQLNLDIGNANGALSDLTAQQKALQNKKQQQTKYLAQQIRASYSAGRQEYLKVLLNQDSPGDLSRMLAYYGYFNRARSEQIDGYNDTISALRENQEQINRQQQALQEDLDDLEKKHQALDANKAQRKQILANLENSIESKDSELKELLANRQQLEQVVQRVEKAVAEAGITEPGVPLTRLKGKLPWPAQGAIIRSYGSLDPTTNSNWQGILIQANEGENVHAVHHGTVVFSDWLRGFGLLIILDHGDGYLSLYGQNQALYKEIGDIVKPGDVIASIGSSGGRALSGLYFEIRKDGKPQNPQQWIVARK